MRQLVKTNSKRLKIAIATGIIYILIGILALFVAPAYLKDMGIYLGATSMPILMYIVGESFRPSTNKSI